MIKNERQYRITKAQARNFERALADLKEKSEKDREVHPLLQRAELDALCSQLEDLRSQLREYEELRSGQIRISGLETLEELPQTLIKARIAAGLTQKELGERLGLKEQQIQRYEATEYRSASLARLLEIREALSLKRGKEILPPDAEISPNKLFSRLKRAGLDTDFLINRFIPSHLLAQLESEPKGAEMKDRTGSVVMQVAAIVGRVFGWTADAIFGHSNLELDMTAAGSASFKVPSRAEERRLNAYIVYAHYLALLVLQGTSGLSQATVPTDPKQVREAVLSNFGPITLENVLSYVWSLGVPVLPLDDPGAFHGACWRVAGRNIIVLKQRTRSQARWLFDLLHELRHVGDKPGQDHLAVIEADPSAKERRDPVEEETASQFAGDVVLSCRAEELAELCVREARGAVEWLKNAVPRVAKRENVPVDSLANYMAFRLSLQDINWWGTAENLQVVDSKPWLMARDLLLEKIKFDSLNEVDRNLLVEALSEREG